MMPKRSSKELTIFVLIEETHGSVDVRKLLDQIPVHNDERIIKHCIEFCCIVLCQKLHAFFDVDVDRSSLLRHRVMLAERQINIGKLHNRAFRVDFVAVSIDCASTLALRVNERQAELFAELWRPSKQIDEQIYLQPPLLEVLVEALLVLLQKHVRQLLVKESKVCAMLAPLRYTFHTGLVIGKFWTSPPSSILQVRHLLVHDKDSLWDVPRRLAEGVGSKVWVVDLQKVEVIVESVVGESSKPQKHRVVGRRRSPSDQVYFDVRRRGLVDDVLHALIIVGCRLGDFLHILVIGYRVNRLC